MRRLPTLLTAAALLGLLALPSASTATASKGAKATKADRNRDGLPDKWEKRYGLSLRIKQAKLDPDNDGLRNRDEFREGTNPRYRDTDNDRLPDGDERPTGHDPLDPDSDDDGVQDGRENPGRVVSFKNGALVISLSGSRRVTVRVNADTDIFCDDASGSGGDEAPVADNGDQASGDSVLARTDYDREGGDPVDTSGDDPVTDDPAGDDAITDDPAGDGCTTADLVPGAFVHEAELRLVDGTLVARSIELREKI